MFRTPPPRFRTAPSMFRTPSSRFRTAPPTFRTALPTFRTAPPAFRTAPPTFRTPPPTFRTTLSTFRTSPPTFRTPSATFRTPWPTSRTTPSTFRTPPATFGTPTRTPWPLVSTCPDPSLPHPGPKRPCRSASQARPYQPGVDWQSQTPVAPKRRSCKRQPAPDPNVRTCPTVSRRVTKRRIEANVQPRSGSKRDLSHGLHATPARSLHLARVLHSYPCTCGLARLPTDPVPAGYAARDH